jgi:crotonobetainyl-CoA:carnitine CoA-transferase CaiB-like acyl-CoA transferase
MLPFEGIKVISLEQAVAAPFASRQLADLGARVIKIERPGVGDFARDYDTTVNGLSSHFVWLNRSKESLTLNLKQPEGMTILSQLLEDADVFIENLAPGALERLGISVEDMAARFPRLIICSISGYGSSGPYRDKKAYDLMIQCETGLISVTGSPDAPSKAGISVADIAAGMYAYSGILTALFMRERTGRGACLELSLFEALAEWMGYPAYYTAYGGTPPARAGTNHAVIVPYGVYATGDGNQVNMAVQNDREWVRFCEMVLGMPDLARDPRFAANPQRVENRGELDGIIKDVFSNLTSAQVVERLDAAGIANAHMNSVQQFWEHPQLQARNRWATVNSPVGELRALIPPVTIPGVSARMDPIPELGQHTQAILQEIGYQPAAIEDLRCKGAI